VLYALRPVAAGEELLISYRDATATGALQTEVGLALFHVLLQSKHYAYMMTASMFHVTNLTPPGSECNPGRRRASGITASSPSPMLPPPPPMPTRMPTTPLCVSPGARRTRLTRWG
jgi:hypothetical protein